MYVSYNTHTHIISPFKCSEGPFPLSLFISHSIFLEKTKYFFSFNRMLQAPEGFKKLKKKKSIFIGV